MDDLSLGSDDHNFWGLEKKEEKENKNLVA